MRPILSTAFIILLLVSSAAFAEHRGPRVHSGTQQLYYYSSDEQYANSSIVFLESKELASQGGVVSSDAGTPIYDVNSPWMRCGRGAPDTYVGPTVTIPIDAEPMPNIEYYLHERGDDITPNGEFGIFQVWLAPLSTNGHGDVWTKIWSQGRFAAKGWYPTDQMMGRTPGSRGPGDRKAWFYFPFTLKDGDYLVRMEFIMLDNAAVQWKEGTEKGARIYAECVAVTIDNIQGKRSGWELEDLPKKGFSFPGSYDKKDPGIVWDANDPVKSVQRYPMPGGDVFFNDCWYPSPL